MARGKLAVGFSPCPTAALRPFHKFPDRGLTLIELLIVIAIQAFLVAILLPSLSAARATARQSACLATLSTWGRGFQYYAQEFSGFLPRRGQGLQVTTQIDRADDWFNAVPVMLGESSLQQRFIDGRRPRPGDTGIWNCPAGPADLGFVWLAYAMSMRVSTWNDAYPTKQERIPKPASLVLLTEGPGPRSSVLPSSAPWNPDVRHRGSINILFLDGHVSAFTGSAIGCGAGDPKREDVQWFDPESIWPGPQ
mgnify:CR=1 FL=1